MADVLNVKDVVVKFKGNIIGCLSSASLDLKADTAEVSCQASGGWSEFTVGRKSWSGSVDGVYRELSAAEQATGVTFDTMFDSFDNSEKVTIEYGKGDGSGSRYTGTAFVSGLKLTYPAKDAVTWSATLTGTGALVKVTTP